MGSYIGYMEEENADWTITVTETGYATTINAFTNKVGFTDSPYVVLFADGHKNTMTRLDFLPHLLKDYKGRGDYAVYALIKRGEGEIGEEYGKPFVPPGTLDRIPNE